MNKKFMIMGSVLALMFCFNTFLLGQETTGNIEGTITDPNGARVAGVTVELVSESYRRTITANEEGFFRALQLPPGVYTVNITASNFQPFKRENVQVTLGQTTPVNVQLAISGVTGEVTVVGTDQLAIDPTSSRIQTNLTEKELEMLPKGVGFASALRAVPSVRPEPSAAGYSVDGATGVENSFVIDGQEVSNFRTGGLNTSNNLPINLVRELQVKNSGFEAEFGGATGGVINVVTKSGGNNFHGDAGLEFGVSRFNATGRLVQRADPDVLLYINRERPQGTDFFPSFSLGGPIVKDRVWFFVSATPQFFETIRTWTFGDGSRGAFKQEQTNDYYFARVDTAITNNLRVYSTFTYNPVKVNGLLPAYNTLFAADTLSETSSVNPADQAELGGRVAANNFTINGNYVATPNLVFSARFSRGYLNEGFDFFTNSGGYGIPSVTRVQCSTSGRDFGYDCDAGFSNVTTNDRILKDISIRKNFDADASWIVKFGGRHQFKFGYQRYGIFNDVASGYVEPGRVLLNFGRTTTAADGTVFGNRPGEAGYARLVLIGEFGTASSKNEALYIQDSWQPFSNLTLNLGVRTEREDVPSFTPGFEGIQFDWSDKIAPRIGFAYDVFSNGKFKIFGNYGQFFDRFKYELPRGSFGGNIFDDYRAPILTSRTDKFSYTKADVLARSLVYTNFRVPSNDPTDFRVDPDLKPVRQTEYTFGAEYELGANTILRGRYTHKQIDTTIEDIGFHDENDDESYFIGNPGIGVCAQSACGRYNVGSPAAKPIRKYDALELVLDKRFATNATINASYTFSRLFGNYSGLASTDEFLVNNAIARDSPNVNRFFDVPFNEFTVGGQSNAGRLPTDRPHVFKFFGSYVFNGEDSSLFRLPRSHELQLSTFFTAQSGTPITTRVELIDVAYIPLFGRGDRGRTEMFSQTDASVSYRYRFGRDNRFGMQFNIDVLNLFNENNVMGFYELISDHNFDVSDFPGVTITDRQDFDRAFFDGRITAQRILDVINAPGNAINQDKRFGQPLAFQGSRNVRFGFRFFF